MDGMIKCFIILEFHKIILMEHQKDIPKIWTLLKIQRVKPGEKEWTVKQTKLKNKELLMLEQLSTNLIQ